MWVSAGVIHGNIKMTNVTFTDSGPLKLTDFKLAKIGDGAGVPRSRGRNSGCDVARARARRGF
jgi:hypothetical protein